MMKKILLCVIAILPCMTGTAQITDAADWQHVDNADAIPVVAVEFNYKLNKHWRLNTGLEYAISKTTVSSMYDGDYHKWMDRSMTYVGIPLRVQYVFVDKRDWTLYASAGVTGEKCVTNSEYYEYWLGWDDNYSAWNSSDSYAVYGKYKNGKEKPFQFSMNVGAGVQFDANPHWGLFLHAETGYYFSDGSDIINFYSHAKIPLKIQFGVCVNFYRKNKKNNNNEVQ